MFDLKVLVRLTIVAAIYVALTLLVTPLSYGPIQLRFSEILLLLCFFNPMYGVALIIGCFLANLASPLGWLDWVFGTSHTIIAVLFIIWARKNSLPLWVASLGAIIGTPLIGWELHIVFGLPFVISTLWVAAGEFIVVTVFGVPIFRWLEKRKQFDKTI